MTTIALCWYAISLVTLGLVARHFGWITKGDVWVCLLTGPYGLLGFWFYLMASGPQRRTSDYMETQAVNPYRAGNADGVLGRPAKSPKDWAAATQYMRGYWVGQAARSSRPLTKEALWLEEQLKSPPES